MWKDILAIIPREIVLAAVLYGAVSWFITGPLVAERTAETRFLPACIAGLEALPLLPSPQERMLEELQNSPLLQTPLARSFGVDRYFEMVRRRKEAERDAARAAPGARCRCLVDQALGRSQVSWALYAASLRLIARPQVVRFDGLMARIEKEGLCHG